MSGQTGLKVKEAFPLLFGKAYPSIEPKTPLLSVLPLLRFHEIDALPFALDARRKQRGVFGYSCLSRLLALRRGQLSDFLKQPCENVSDGFETVQATDSLSQIFDAFLGARFGLVRVVEKGSVGGFVSLADALGLYGAGAVRTQLDVNDVATPVFSMRPEETVRDALEEMFQRRYRRVFIRGTKKFIWDRSIIGHVFSPAALARASDGPSVDILDFPISEIEASRAEAIAPATSLRTAANLLKARGALCFIFDKRVVTPWDVVVKPWKMRELRVAKIAQN